jgi:DNA polymerase-3 subunit delta
MASDGAASDQQTQLRALVRDAGQGTYKPVYLFVGEPFQTAAAAKSLVDALVPSARRDFNLEVYDGRTTPITRALDSARMHGFFAGVKVVWLRETTVFLSGEKRAEVTKALLHAWSEGREEEAAEKLLTLVALAGWPQEQFADTRWSSLSKTRVKEVFGDDLDAEQMAQLDALQGVCMARELTVGSYRDDGGVLIEFLDAGVPADTVLLLSASTVDARKRLYKRVEDLGVVLNLSAERERSGALSREAVEELLGQVLREHGKRLVPAARDVILRRAGADLALLASELEKLCLAVGERDSIGEDDVRRNVLDMAESWIFDFTGALSSRQIARALPLLRGLFDHGEPPLRLLAMIVREVRLLLVARECLDGALRGKWRPDLQYNAFQSRVLPHVDSDTSAAFGKGHPFVLFRRFQDASRLSARALRDAMTRLSDLDLRLKSSRTDPALLLEAFVIDWCGRGRSAHGNARPGKQRDE